MTSITEVDCKLEFDVINVKWSYTKCRIWEK